MIAKLTTWWMVLMTGFAMSLNAKAEEPFAQPFYLASLDGVLEQALEDQVVGEDIRIEEARLISNILSGPIYMERTREIGATG